MIKSINISNKAVFESVQFETINNKINIDCNKLFSNKSNSFTLEITFLEKIVSFRNHDYTWVDINSDRIATSLSPKIIKLHDGNFVQANCTTGVWEINNKKPHILLWKFNPEFSNSLTEYTGKRNLKKLVSANSVLNFTENLTLLFTKSNALEISRSQIPFSAISCFTDHCDFDTVENLKLQRELFKELNIKITKGFFLNHFSKRVNNASFEKQKLEIESWKDDNHELCYHSLSQSIKSDEQSFTDFKNFIPPYNSIPVWIDHGFQPYNFSLYKNNKISNEEYEKHLIQKNILTQWNYIDAGTATTGIINQLNPNQFTLEKYWNGIHNFNLKTRIIKLIKNIIFHHDNNEKRVINYIVIVGNLRAIFKDKKITKVFSLISNAIPLFWVICKVFLFWNSDKKKPYKVAKYSPILFKHKINNQEFNIFQTLEMVDFKKGIANNNVDLLIKESGVFIAHTYFSVDMNHYLGKLFKSENQLDEEVVSNFKYLSDKIKNKQIWNPTLSQLIQYLDTFEKTIFDIDTNGTIFIKNNSSIPSRKVT